MLVGQYARNIERPPFYTLNPNRIQSSDYSYQIGNPYLRPTYINRFSVTLVYNYRYTVTVGGNLHHDLIREFCKQDVANPDVSYITYENHDRENHWFVAVSLPYQPFTWCNLTGNFIGVRQDIRMTELSSFSSHYLGFANAIATFTLPAGFTVEARYSGTSRLYSGNSEVAPRHTVGVMARKKLLNDKLLLAVSVDNIFNQANEYASTLDVYRTSSRYENGFTGRVFKVALTWNFNSGKKVRKSKIEIGSERSRLNENNNRKVAQKYQWPYLWIRIYIFTLDEEQDKINTVMEDRKLSEKESLDIITQMINSSKRNMKVGSGNVLLYWGYFTVLLSVVISSLIVYTQNYIWSWGWMLMFAVGPVISYKQRGCEPAVVTYTDKTISSVWQVFGCMFGLTFVLIAAFCVLYEQSVNFILMLPLSLLYCGLGVSINGIILREKWMIYSPVVAFVLVIYMLMSLINHGPVTVLWYLYFGLSFVVMMIIPGHILNNKAKNNV